MENELNPEKRIEKAEVIVALKETKDFKNPIVQGWLTQREAEVMKEGTARARILYNVEQVDLYVAADDMNGSFVCLKELKINLDLDQSLSKRDVEELYGVLYKKMDEVNYPKDDSAIVINSKITKYIE